MTEQREKPPVLPYRPTEPAELPLVRRAMVALVHIGRWIPMILGLVLTLIVCVAARLSGHRAGPITVGELVFDLFLGWLVAGLCITAVQFFRKSR